MTENELTGFHVAVFEKDDRFFSEHTLLSVNFNQRAAFGSHGGGSFEWGLRYFPPVGFQVDFDESRADALGLVRAFL